MLMPISNIIITDSGMMLGSTDANVRQVLNGGQALKLAQPTVKYQDAVTMLCAKAAGTGHGHKGAQSPGGVAAYEAFTENDFACPLVRPASTAACLHHIVLVLSS